MKKKIITFKRFSRDLHKGLKVEFKETMDIPLHIKNREFKKAGEQVVDIAKIVGLATIWVVPGGAVATSLILKYYHKARPSAFIPPKNNPTIENDSP